MPIIIFEISDASQKNVKVMGNQDQFLFFQVSYEVNNVICIELLSTFTMIVYLIDQKEVDL